MCQENSRFIKIWQELTGTLNEDLPSFWCLAQFLEREMFQTEVVQKTKTHILCSITVSSKIVLFVR